MNHRKWYRGILAVILIFFLTACTSSIPPRELSPNGDLVKKAIALQLKLTEQVIADSLSATNPNLKISNIRVKELEPIYIGKLAVYHLQGKFNLNIKLPSRQVTQKDNQFDIYLQRQIEGKTWRLLKKEPTNPQEKPTWKSYLLK
jgi:hypothetical protein